MALSFQIILWNCAKEKQGSKEWRNWQHGSNLHVGIIFCYWNCLVAKAYTFLIQKADGMLWLLPLTLGLLIFELAISMQNTLSSTKYAMFRNAPLLSFCAHWNALTLPNLWDFFHLDSPWKFSYYIKIEIYPSFKTHTFIWKSKKFKNCVHGCSLNMTEHEKWIQFYNLGITYCLFF